MEKQAIILEAASAFHAIGLEAIRSRKREYPEVWKLCIEYLIEIDKKVYGRREEKVNFQTTSYIASFPVRYTRTEPNDWELIKSHFFKYFRKALGEKRIKLKRAKSHTEIDYLSAMCSLLFSARDTQKFERWCSVQAKIIREFREAIGYRFYPPEESFAVIFHVIADGIEIFKDKADEKYLKSLDNMIIRFAKVAYPKLKRKEAAKKLLEDSKKNILHPEGKYIIKTTRKIKETNPDWPKERFDKFYNRFSAPAT